jgi:hypothetical protein
MATFVLIHSPIVGPLTWSSVAEELRLSGIKAIVPDLAYDVAPKEPYWKLHAKSVGRALKSVPENEGLILAGHSGAGMLLPAIRQISGRAVAGYIFVDADIPEDGGSRLEILRRELPQAAEEVYRALSAGEMLPAWGDADLREIIPEVELRQRVLADLRPHPLAFMEEAIPVFEGWPEAPCGYLSFKRAGSYRESVERAKREGWAYAELDGAHFHILVDPHGVAEALVGLAERLQVKGLTS